MSDPLRPHGLWPSRLLCPWKSPDKNTGVGCHALLQGIFPTQGSNLGLLHCRWILHCLSHQGNPRILEWVAYPFSRGSSRPGNWTGVSCIAGGFFTSWANTPAILSSPYSTWHTLSTLCHHICWDIWYGVESIVCLSWKSVNELTPGI